MIKNKFRSFLLILLLLVCGSRINQVKACHYASGDLYVTYIGAGLDGCTGTTQYVYQIDLVMYFACQTCSGTLGDTLYPGNGIKMWAGHNPGLGFKDIGMKRIIYDTVTQICPAFYNQNSCIQLSNANKYPAYQRQVFRAIVDMSDPTYGFPGNEVGPDFKFAFGYGGGQCCRPNPANIGGSSFYLEAGLNNQVRYNNSSPRFLSSPLRYICANFPATFLNGPFDINGDSMVTSNYQSLSDVNNPIPYLTGYSPNYFIDVDPSNPYKLDPITGTATFTPTTAGTYQIAYRIDEYEKGTGIHTGYSMRDFNLQVLSCSEPPPPIDSVPANISQGSVVRDKVTNAQIIYTCPGSKLNFSVESSAALPTSQLYLEADMPTAGPAGAVFTVTPGPNGGAQSVKGVFDWTPAASDIGDHIVIVTSKDSTCSGSGYTIVQKTSTVYTIRVTPGIDLGPDIPICAINNTEKQLFVKGGENLRLRWEEYVNGVQTPGAPLFLTNPTIQNPRANPNVTVAYVVSTPDLQGSTCKVKDTIELRIDTMTTLTVFPDKNIVLCDPEFLQLEAIISGQKPTGNIQCGINAEERVTCINPDTVRMYGSPVYGIKTKYDTLGSSSIVLTNNVKTAKMAFLITKDEMGAYGFRSGTINGIGMTVAVANTPGFQYENFRIRMGCTTKKSLRKSDGFEKVSKLTDVFYSSTPLVFAPGDMFFKLSQGYNWDTTQNLIIEICYSNPTQLYTCTNPGGDAPVLSFVPTEYVGGLVMKAADTFVKTVCGVEKSALIEERTTRPKFTFTFCEAPVKDYDITWTPSFLVSDSTIAQPLAYVTHSNSYVIETHGRIGCKLRDTINVYLPVRDYSIRPADTSICYGADAILSIDKGSYYKWYEYEDGQYKLPTSLNCNTCRVVNARPKKTTTYRIAIYDSVFCLDTIEARINVLPSPNVKLLTNDTVIRYGRSLQLLATGARQYNWLPAGSLSTPNTSSPVATPSEPTTYVVTGIGANGCRSFDTVKVDIDYRDNIFVPTAFSPNGDGKNDVFRITNLTFQRLMEFRVFNRWGQEIFSTTDVKGGWDGTWKGEPQPVDNYRYIIRVGFPDGIVETYKGDVTLIR